ncbi:MAG: transcription antitermination factor NusB [Elusimicrobiota bacterium]
MGRRRQAREFALQALYLSDTGSVPIEDAFGILAPRYSMDEKTSEFARGLARGTVEHQQDLDVRIQSVAENWELKRMAAVDRSLLRMASYELLFCPETPVGVIIDEALEIAKVFSSQDSSRFINGILDKIKPGK